jgi:hypothetical protein
MGLFGCLIFYDHVTSNAMQSLEEVVKKTALFRSIRVSDRAADVVLEHRCVVLEDRSALRSCRVQFS